MGRLTNDDVRSLIRDIAAGPESAVRPPAFSAGTAGEPPHLVWGLGSGQPMAVGVMPGGPEYRTGEYWAAGYSELEVTDDPWVVDGVARDAAALRESMRVASERQAKLAVRASTVESSTAGKSPVDTVVAYLGSPSPDRFEQLFSDVALWVDHRDDDESVVAGVSRRLDGATVTARWTAAGRLVLSGPHGERTVTPKSRDTTLRALATTVGPEFELRQWVGGIPGDTVAIVVLPTEAWTAVAAARSVRARDAQFRRIHARSTIFG
jgi:hypothetical protein